MRLGMKKLPVVLSLAAAAGFALALTACGDSASDNNTPNTPPPSTFVIPSASASVVPSTSVSVKPIYPSGRVEPSASPSVSTSVSVSASAVPPSCEPATAKCVTLHRPVHRP